MKEYRKWYERGKVLEIACKGSDGVSYRHPVRPWSGNEWDNMVACGLMAQGYTVLIVDYGWIFERPDVYNEVPEINSQLCLNFD